MVRAFGRSVRRFYTKSTEFQKICVQTSVVCVVQRIPASRRCSIVSHVKNNKVPSFMGSNPNIPFKVHITFKSHNLLLSTEDDKQLRHKRNLHQPHSD